MLAQIPVNLGKLKKEELERELLRVAIIAELDAVNLYNQLAAMTDNEKIRDIFYDVAREEKTHVGEFQAMLLERDKEQVKELEKGMKEVKELTTK
jgi:rubrerythrin